MLIVLYLSKNMPILSEGKKVHCVLDHVLSKYPELHGVTVHSRYQLIRDELIDLGKTLLAGIIFLSVFAVLRNSSYLAEYTSPNTSVIFFNILAQANRR